MLWTAEGTVSDKRVFTMASVRLDASGTVSHRDLSIFAEHVDAAVEAPDADPDDVW